LQAGQFYGAEKFAGYHPGRILRQKNILLRGIRYCNPDLSTTKNVDKPETVSKPHDAEKRS
jgi:hypothetical protein